jgi:hypothetical protein
MTQKKNQIYFGKLTKNCHKKSLLGSLQLILNHKTKNENNNVQVEIRFLCQNMAILCPKKPYFPHHLGYKKL